MVGGALIGIGAASISATGIASAATNSSRGNSLVEKIATRFNLNKEDVQKVFDEERESHKKEHESKINDRLDLAVKDGKLTQEQADKLKAKLEQLQTERENNRQKGSKPDKTEMKQKMDDLKKWLKDNNIPEEYGMPMGGDRGHHHRMGMNNENN